MSSGDKTSPGLTIDRAAFLLLRVKNAFKKKKKQQKEKSWRLLAPINVYHGLEVNMDVRNDELIERTYGIVVTQLIDVMNVLTGLMKKTEDDFKKVNRRLRRKRRKDSDEDPNDASSVL
ncbi:PREDICTED: uncharacterized protein LOC105153240 isoform X2 [Acromyrmex echinatior]|nr:PREDICTED: uncharacterized protein LOC105153240 isoform X2 [Acromyrmex echinatior]XP_011066272.1 PREDICTED: uncharacterized protein LOC105153240 isoform X2 [Acromyrmex echinatior]